MKIYFTFIKLFSRLHLHEVFMIINCRTGVTFSESVLLLSNNLILLLMSARFDFSNSFIWFEFYNAPLTKDIKLICDVSERLFFLTHLNYFTVLISLFSGQTIRSWYIIGRLGGCNSMNMQVSFVSCMFIFMLE